MQILVQGRLVGGLGHHDANNPVFINEVDDLEAWTMTTNGNQLLMSGALSAEGFRQIGMLVEQPIKHELVASDSSSGEGAPEVNMATFSGGCS